MKKAVTILGLVAFVVTLSFAQKSKAYEQDTHLRFTYLLCRAVGINDETAKYLAYSNLNVDKSVLTSAMLHPAQRGLMHFTGTYQKLQSSAHGGEGILAQAKELFWSRKLAIAERNHSMGSLLIYMGMLKGDLQLVGAGLHVKQDTYGHAGFTNAWGHMFDGHNPDRAFLETEKYEDMIRSLTQTLASVRDTLPEHMLDRASAIKYLNQFAKESSLKRNLTAVDLNSATTVSAVLLSSPELKRMYSENIFNNKSFKKLALKLIYDDFKSRDVIAKNISFDELFPKAILESTHIDTADAIKAAIVSDFESDFLKNKDGKDLINTTKLFGAKNIDQVLKKSGLEQERYERRLREFENNRIRFAKQGNLSDLDYQIVQEALQKEYTELSVGMNLDNTNGELAEAMKNAPVELQEKIKNNEELIRQKYATEIDNAEKTIAKGLSKDLPLEDRIEALRIGGEVAEKVISEISEMKRSHLFEIFVKIRSRQLAEYKLATEIADRLTKDFIPRKYNQYIKQSFESDAYTRVFEVQFKDEAWRRYISKHFNANWVFNENNTANERLIHDMSYKFKKLVNREGLYKEALEKRTQRLLYREALKLAEERIPGDLGSRAEAQSIKYSGLSTLEWNMKMLKYIGPAVVPFYGEFYLQKKYDLADKEAKKHETENIKEALLSGKYKQPTDKTILNQISAFAAPNKCVRLFN